MDEPSIRSAGMSPTTPNSTGVAVICCWPLTSWLETSPAYHVYCFFVPGVGDLMEFPPTSRPLDVRTS